MRCLPVVIIVAALLAACAPTAKSTCETRPDGVRLFVDTDTAAYGDLVEALRRDPQQAAASPPAGGEHGSGFGPRPLVCETDRQFSRMIHIQYQPRDQRHIGAFLDFYMGEDGRVEVAEFQVMPLAL